MGRGGSGGPGNIVFGTYEGHDIVLLPGKLFRRGTRQACQPGEKPGPAGYARYGSQMVWYQAFINTAEHVAILLQAEKAGASVSEDAVDKALLSFPGYMDDSGRFSETRYASTSAADRDATRKLTRESLLTNIFASDIINGVKAGTQETDFVKSMASTERSFTFVSLPFSSFPNEAVRAYADANKARFLHIKLSRILIKSGETQATEIRKKILDKTSTFDELAKTYSKDEYADKGGDMGWRYAYDVEADFDAKETAQKVLTLKAGELSDVLKGTFGWLIYRCDSEAIAPDFSNATVLEDVKSYLNRYEKGKVEDYFNGKAAQLATRAAAVGFDKAAQEAGLKVASTELFPVNLGNVFSFAPLRAVPDTETPTNAVYNEDFFIKAFSLAKDKVSAPIVLDDRVLVMKLKEERTLPGSHREPPGQLDQLHRQPVDPVRPGGDPHDPQQAEGQFRGGVRPVRDAYQQQAVGSECPPRSRSSSRQMRDRHCSSRGSSFYPQKNPIEYARRKARAFSPPRAHCCTSPPWDSATACGSCFDPGRAQCHPLHRGEPAGHAVRPFPAAAEGPAPSHRAHCRRGGGEGGAAEPGAAALSQGHRGAPVRRRPALPRPLRALQAPAGGRNPKALAEPPHPDSAGQSPGAYLLSNLAVLPSAMDFSALSSSLPTVVAGAGPSLDASIPALREHRGRFSWLPRTPPSPP